MSASRRSADPVPCSVVSASTRSADPVPCSVVSASGGTVYPVPRIIVSASRRTVYQQGNKVEGLYRGRSADGSFSSLLTSSWP